MGKVAVVAHDGAAIQLNFYYITFFTAKFAKSMNLESIKTSKSFDERGDKDCHHRNVSGLVFFDPTKYGGQYTVQNTARYYDPSIEPLKDLSQVPFRDWDRTWNDTGVTQYFRTESEEILPLCSNLVHVSPSGFQFFCPKQFWVKVEDHARYGDFEDGPTKPGNPYVYIHHKWRVVGKRAYYRIEIYDGRLMTDYSFEYPGPGGVPHTYRMFGDPINLRLTVKRGYVEILSTPKRVAYIIRVDEKEGEVQRAVASYKAFFSRRYNAGPVMITEDLFSSICNRVRLMSHERLNSLQFAAPYGKIPKAEKTELISKAITDAKVLTINSLAFLRDLSHLKELIVPLLKLKKKPLSAKAWASLWLTYEYGIRLLIQDIHEIVTKLPKSDVKFNLTHVRAMSQRTLTDDVGREVDVHYHCKVILDPRIGPIVTVLDKLRRLDLVVSRENLWDFVPFSFVVDWFIPIGEILSHLDLRTDIDLFGAKVAILSSKATRSLTTTVRPRGADREGGISEYCIQLILNLKVYNRWHEDPTISIPTVEVGNGLNLRRGADGFALLVQKFSRS